MLAIAANTRARIKAVKAVGSARRLHGLTATVVGPHPLGIPGWVEIRLDANSVTDQVRWTVPEDRLEVIAEREAYLKDAPAPRDPGEV